MGSSKMEMPAKTFWAGFLFGVGLIAFLDEAVFHQVLHWHHFYDGATKNVGLVSDGLFHAFSWFATIGGLFMLADLRRRNVLHWTRWWGSVLIGAGAFQLYDGIVHHKLMEIHQIRYVENVVIYDIVWNLAAVILMAAGALMIAADRKNSQRGRSA